MTTGSNEIGKTLEQRRLSLELTLRELADKSGVSASHLSRIEKGERFPSGHILRKLAKPLKLDESLLMTIAGYLPESSEEHVYKGLDPYVAKVLSEESVHVQQTVAALLTVLKGAMAESLSRKQDWRMYLTSGICPDCKQKYFFGIAQSLKEGNES